MNDSQSKYAPGSESGTRSVSLDGRRITLDDRSLIGQGGEADVYGHGDLALKVYRRPNASHQAKLERFPSGLPAEVVGPRGLLRDARGQVVGFSMRRVVGAFPLHRLMRRSWRAGRITMEAVLALFRRLHSVLEALHRRGIVVGDLNEANLLFIPGGGLALIDADSMQFDGLPCPVGHPRFIAQELFGKALGDAPHFTPHTDWYAFSVLLFQSVLYIHPYGGVHPTAATFEQRALGQLSCLRGDVKTPGYAAPTSALPPELWAAFEATFDGGARGRFDPTLLSLPWTRCDRCGVEHGRRDCPKCAPQMSVPDRPVQRRSGGCTARRVVHVPRGCIVHAEAPGGRLRYLTYDGQVLARENGTVVAQGPPRPGLQVGLGPRITWVGAGEQLVGLRETAVGPSLERAASSTFDGETSLAMAGHSLIRLDGDRIVDHERAITIGRAAAERTWIAAGMDIGCGFYRAGRILRWFSFATRVPGLRDLPIPTLSGRLLRVAAAFSGSRIALHVECEDPGRPGSTTLELFVLEASGRLLGRWDGQGCAVGGACLTSHHLLLPTDDGVLRLAVTDSGLSQATLLADTEPFVTGADRLLPGPKGTLYAVSDVSIIQLSTGGY